MRRVAPERWTLRAPLAGRAPAARLLISRYALVNECTKLPARAAGARAAGPGRLTGQGGPEALLADMPEVMLDAVDQRHGDLVPVFAQVALGLSDIELFPAHTEVGSDPRDDLARVVAQVTSRPAEQGDDVRIAGHGMPLLHCRAGWSSRGAGGAGDGAGGPRRAGRP